MNKQHASEEQNLTDAITRALQSAVRKALLKHKRDGDSVVVWRDGKVVWVPPEEIPDFNEHDESERDDATAGDTSPPAGTLP